MTELRARYILKIHTEFDTTVIPGYFTKESAMAVAMAIEAGEARFSAHIKDINTGEMFALGVGWEPFEV